MGLVGFSYKSSCRNLMVLCWMEAMVTIFYFRWLRCWVLSCDVSGMLFVISKWLGMVVLVVVPAWGNGVLLYCFFCLFQ